VNEAELLPLLARMFPSFRGIPEDEARRRGEALGLFTARALGAGPEVMASKGVQIPPAAVQSVGPAAQQAVQAGQGGLRVLCQLRPAINEDRVYAAALVALAKLYAESLRGGGQAAAPAAPPPASGDGGFVLPGPPQAAGAPVSLAPPAAAATPPAATPPPAGESLIPGGVPLGPAATLPPALGSPPGGLPASGGGLDLAPSGGGSGGLDFAPAGAAIGGAAPAPAPATPSSGGLELASGGLDLAPSGPAPASAGRGVDLAPSGGGSGGLDLAPLDLAPEPGPPPAAPAPAPAPPSSSGGLDLADEPEPSAPHHPAAASFLYDDGGAAPGGGPKDPVARAFWSFERTGDLQHLQQAATLLQEERKNAPHVMAAAMAQGGMAKVARLQGDAATAKRLAEEAIQHYPACPQAVEVLVRLDRGEAASAGFNRSLARLAFALDQRDLGQVRALADALIKAFPNEPLPYLSRMFAGSVSNDQQELETYLKAAWQRYPSQDHADMVFGGAVDADVATALLTYGRGPYKSMEEEGLLKTITNVDSKENLIAGSLRMAVGLAKIAFTRGGNDKALQRQLHTVVGQGMMGLQYFEAAPEEFGKALMLGPSQEEHKAISNERIQCQALWRAFDKPGIKVQQKKFRCIGSEGMVALLKRRLEQIGKDRTARQEHLYGRGPEVVEKALSDPAFRDEIKQAALEQAMDDPMEVIEDLDRELKEIEAERDASDEQPAKKKGGLFGAIKAAASSAASAAKGAQLKFKEGQIQSKRTDAIRRVAIVLAKDLHEFEFKHPYLVAFSRQAATLEAFCDYYETEEAQVKAAMGSLSFSK
jgi:tetratricopeptide (TPR) repeat protein